MRHFMIGAVYGGRCSDGVTRRITVDDVSLASSDGTCPGLYLSGVDREGYRYGAYTIWTTQDGYRESQCQSEVP